MLARHDMPRTRANCEKVAANLIEAFEQLERVCRHEATAGVRDILRRARQAKEDAEAFDPHGELLDLVSPETRQRLLRAGCAEGSTFVETVIRYILHYILISFSHVWSTMLELTMVCMRYSALFLVASASSR